MAGGGAGFYREDADVSCPAGALCILIGQRGAMHIDSGRLCRSSRAAGAPAAHIRLSH